MTPARLQYLLEKYLNGTATSAEQEEYDRWYNREGLLPEAPWTPEEVEAVYAKINAGISRKKVFQLRWAAAAAVLLLAGTWWIMRAPHTDTRKTLVIQKAVHPDSMVIRNTTGNTREINLPDGSLVTLYKDATIRFAAPFGARDRTILLHGKGFFNVAKSATAPFTVISEQVATTALGTSFTIAGMEKEVKVTLHTGKVMVKTTAQTMYLRPGQQLLCDVHTGITRLQPATPARPAVMAPVISYGSRSGFTAMFDQTPLANVLDTIAKGYQVNIHVQHDAFRDIAFSGVIRDTDSLAQVLHRIAMLHDLKIVTTHTGYRIEKNH
ncbi:FecR family protein [Chitinophaga nivalis]|uniref:FecR domain-containing protein n=1 Tax=Chitinophaga nivalis TaxID=2991709 RepID=A0ABT3IFI0_9BACT|nr:FecR domain-containing protein [Chitinophaga nivalis]MCW3467592.1 FecR domain-containing protein [Chitinophaga nivalis]MCW3482716.1 FecR domain-containing protein [Chitinophaga nivalis]